MDRAASCRVWSGRRFVQMRSEDRQDSFAVTVEMDCFESTDNVNAETYGDFQTRSLHELFG